MKIETVAKQLAQEKNARKQKSDRLRRRDARRVQLDVIEPICKRFKMAFLVAYDESTFVYLEPHPKCPDGVWVRPQVWIRESLMSNARTKETRKAIEACYDAINRLGLTSRFGKEIHDFPNGIDKALEARVTYQLGSLACCP